MKKILIKGQLNNYFIFPNNPNFNYDLNERFGKNFIGFSENESHKFLIKHLKINKSNPLLSLFYHHENLLNFNNQRISKSVELITEKEHLFLIKEYIDGVSLRDFNRSYSFRSSTKIIEILSLYKNILQNISLIHASESYIVDLKPANIIITDYSNKGKDVQISTSINDLSLAVSKQFTPTAEMKIPYSLYYNAPETLMGFYNLIGPHTDFYSIGFMLAETLLGYHPFKLKHPGMVVEHHMASPIKFDKHIPECVVDLINKATFRTLINKPSNKLSKAEKESVILNSIQNRFENSEQFIENIDFCIEKISTQRKRYSFNIYEPLRIKISSDKAVLIFDDNCILCLKSFKFIRKKDKKSIFRFATFSSDYFKNLKEKSNFIVSNQFVILVYKDKVYTKSDALIKSLVLLGEFSSFALLLKIFPRIIRDFFYNIISKNRFKYWGKNDECYVPQIWEKHLFIK